MGATTFDRMTQCIMIFSIVALSIIDYIVTLAEHIFWVLQVATKMGATTFDRMTQCIMTLSTLALRITTLIIID
jgi:hypothetical protein